MQLDTVHPSLSYFKRKEMFVMNEKLKKLLMTSSNILVSRQRWDKSKCFITALNIIEGDVAFLETADD